MYYNMENKPIVTVFTITRNRADLLPRAMKSVLGQTYDNIEYLIINSASSDNTEEVVKSFNDNRIRYIKLEENKTFGECVNMAYGLATGKYVTELDDDDEYHIDKLEKQVKLFETLSEEYGMVYCWMSYYDSQTHDFVSLHKAEVRGDVSTKVLDNYNLSGTPTLLVRRSIFNIIGGYKEVKDIGSESDWEFAARICQHYKTDFVPESLVNIYINHEHQRMSDVSYYADYYEKRIKMHKYFLSEFAPTFDAHTRLKCHHLLRLSAFSLKAHHYFDSIHYFFKFVYYRIFGTR